MYIIKIIVLLLILISSCYIGILISKKYTNRVRDLKEFKMALNMFSTKIKFTYEPIAEIFTQISEKLNPIVGNIFKTSAIKMKEKNAGKAWEETLDESITNFNKEDIEIIKKLGNLLGKVDLDGQISEIKLVSQYIDKQIENAQEDKSKYVKMYKSLGISIGLAFVIILI